MSGGACIPNSIKINHWMWLLESIGGKQYTTGVLVGGGGGAWAPPPKKK